MCGFSVCKISLIDTWWWQNIHKHRRSPVNYALVYDFSSILWRSQLSRPSQSHLSHQFLARGRLHELGHLRASQRWRRLVERANSSNCKRRYALVLPIRHWRWHSLHRSLLWLTQLMRGCFAYCQTNCDKTMFCTFAALTEKDEAFVFNAVCIHSFVVEVLQDICS